MAAHTALRPTSSFSATITFVGEMTAGGIETNARSTYYQRWHSFISAALDTSIKNAPHLDDVVNASLKTQITFFEPASYRHPTPGSVALVTGKFFMTNGDSEPEIRVRAEPIRVYAYNYCLLLSITPLRQHG